jgi:large subunit ribosomal protein L35
MAKTKMKTKRGAAKRFRVTGTGKLMRRQMGHNHLLSKKSRERKRRLKEVRSLPIGEAKKVRTCLPYV